jgi:hypothetical protein
MNYKIAYILIIILFFSSCEEDELQKKEIISKENYQISDAHVDSLKFQVNNLRKKIYEVSSTSSKILDKNFDLLDYYLFSIIALNEISYDSLGIHAPLDSVNKVIEEYNEFCFDNIGKDCQKLEKFKTVKEYRTNNNLNVSILLKNEIKLHRLHGYYQNDEGEIVVISD